MIKGKTKTDLDAFLNGPDVDEKNTNSTDEKTSEPKKQIKTSSSKDKAQSNKTSKSNSPFNFNLQEKDKKETKTFRLSTEIDNRLTEATLGLTKKGYKVSKSDLVENALNVYLEQIEIKLKS